MAFESCRGGGEVFEIPSQLSWYDGRMSKGMGGWEDGITMVCGMGLTVDTVSVVLP